VCGSVQECKELVIPGTLSQPYCVRAVPQRMPSSVELLCLGHGKGEVDGAGALMKRELRKEQIKPGGQRIHNVEDVVQFLVAESTRRHAAHANVRRNTNNYYWEIKKNEVSRTGKFDCETVKGSKKAHQVSQDFASHTLQLVLFFSISFEKCCFVNLIVYSNRCNIAGLFECECQVRFVNHRDLTLIEMRDVSYFCPACEDVTLHQDCDQKGHVPEWERVRLRPTNPLQIQ
jgi:hypothetical protein